ncbi:hypothetical protein Tsubulata_018983, partial [Turnera subulata]
MAMRFVYTEGEVAEARMHAQLHIESLRSNKFSVGKKEANPLTQDLHNAVKNLSAELYSKDVHFLMELIQNAEDNSYPDGVEPTLEFVLTENDITGLGAPATLLIFNNEVGFSRQNIDSLCSIGLSTKKGNRKLGFIGEKGIGFKSVFLVSSCPHIFSNGYKVRFSEKPDQHCGIGYIVPEWVSAKPWFPDIRSVYGSQNALPTTIIILPLKPEKVEVVKEQLSQLHPELLLFLSKIKRLYVRDSEPGCKTTYDVSIVSISSERHHVERREKSAESYVEFLVKPGNRVPSRMEVEKWTVSLAFPLGNRLTRGTSSIGVFAFLPTSMVTNFPFAVHADFILASSRESILLDNNWNVGILECLPSAFMNAFLSFLREEFPCPVHEAYKFMPVTPSPFPELNKVRHSIKEVLKKSRVVLCSRDLHLKNLFCKPHRAISILPKFRALLLQSTVHLHKLNSLQNYILDSSLEDYRYRSVLEFLGIRSAGASYDWYARCIKECNLALLVSEEVYVDLLCFIAEGSKNAFRNVPLLRYVNHEGDVKVCTIAQAAVQVCKIRYGQGDELHAWLNEINMEVGCPGSIFFLPNTVQQALVKHRRFHFLQPWLAKEARVMCYSASDFADHLCGFTENNKDPKLAVALARFIFVSHRMNFISENCLPHICRKVPIIDGCGRVCIKRVATLVSASSGSKWMKLFGPKNPFVEHCYVDLGEVYAESVLFAGEQIPEKQLLEFISKHSGALDLDGLPPPDAPLQVASSKLTCDQAFLLLDWIRTARARDPCLPKKFVTSVRCGKWLKTYSGFSSPNLSILPDVVGKTIYDMMKNFMLDMKIVDQEFYLNKIGLYGEVMEFLGVTFGLENVVKLILDRTRISALSGLDRKLASSLLMFVGYLKACNKLDEEWLGAIRKGRWLKTSQGYSAPTESVLLQVGAEVESILTITNIPVIDEEYYGGKFTSFSPELELLGVVTDMEQMYKLVSQSMLFPLRATSMNKSSGLLILKCIRYAGSAACEKVKDQPWLKTLSGAKSPMESILADCRWICLLEGLDAPIIDEAFYGDDIRSYVDELKAIGVAVELNSVIKIVGSQLRLLASSSCSMPDNVMKLLDVIRHFKRNLPPYLSEIRECLSKEECLKTRHGYKTPSESILFSLKWGTISFVVDLPLIDDSFYGISIYGYTDELEAIGVATDFIQGAGFVARGLNHPLETRLVTREATVSLLECVKIMMSDCNDQSLVGNFLENLRRSQWLKTSDGYKAPAESILFDVAWDGILSRTDGPIIDNSFYDPDISAYKMELRILGVKVEPLDVCNLLSSLLSKAGDTNLIRRVYSFLNKFNWKPDIVDGCNSQVWVPDANVADGKWVNSKRCVLHDRNNLFVSHYHSLDVYYVKELLPLFSSAFGVAESPSLADYLQLWDNWALRSDKQVTYLECFTFWGCIAEKWNSSTEEMLSKNLALVGAMSSGGEEIYLSRKEEVFIPDDVEMGKIFSSVHGMPLLAWLPKRHDSTVVSPRKLCHIYKKLGVRKISQSIIECLLDAERLMGEVDQRSGLIKKGLRRIFLGFLAVQDSEMPIAKRYMSVKPLFDLQVCATTKPIEVSYRLKLSDSSSLEAKRKQMVFWERSSRWLFVDKSCLEDPKSNVEFVSSFGQEIAVGLLAQERAELVNGLAHIIQMALMFEFREDAVEVLLAKAKMALLKEDEDFLSKNFCAGQSTGVSQKATRTLPNCLAPSTPVDSGKKRRRGS